VSKSNDVFKYRYISNQWCIDIMQFDSFWYKISIFYALPHVPTM